MELTYMVKERRKTVYVASTFEDARQFADHLTENLSLQDDEGFTGTNVLILEFTHGSNPLNSVFGYDYLLERWFEINLMTFEEEQA
ncbi:hypothetical protein LAX75_00840 [Listeria cossartiae]|uniref:hypothetical protein n=1 Tax=Listeria cossartiae TaxID=2838249 RepID=UPI001E2A8811|nr:hypothetical protein [Listeria cossartiae]MCD2223222.1 hypothetical protein [Listeria cossartiae]MCD2237901.1 hypothetical protein [Listeria cossartiae]